MAEAERLTLVAQNEAIEEAAVFDFATEVDRIFGLDRTATKSIETSTGSWTVYLSNQEHDVDMVVFEKVTPVKLPEISTEQLLFNRVKVGVGLRTVRVITETGATIISGDSKKNDDPKNKLNSLSFNTVKVDEVLEVNPELLKYLPTPRSPEHVTQALVGSTALLKTIE